MPDRIESRWLKSGKDALADAMRRLRIADVARATPAQCRALVHAVIEAGRSVIGRIAGLFGRSKIGLAQWATQTLGSLIPVYYGSVLALTPEPTPADLDRVKIATVDQGRYLAKFRKSIRDGSTVATDPATGEPTPGFLNRADLYPMAAWSIAHEVERSHHIEAGFRRERAILGAIHSCDICIDRHEKGWVPIGTLLKIGQSPCMNNCRCHWEFSRSA